MSVAPRSPHFQAMPPQNEAIEGPANPLPPKSEAVLLKIEALSPDN